VTVILAIRPPPPRSSTSLLVVGCGVVCQCSSQVPGSRASQMTS
jgi:hypothetical protein